MKNQQIMILEFDGVQRYFIINGKYAPEIRETVRRLIDGFYENQDNRYKKLIDYISTALHEIYQNGEIDDHPPTIIIKAGSHKW